MALSYVAVAEGILSGSQSSITATSSLNVLAGDGLIAVACWEGADTTVTIQKDTGSPANSFTLPAAAHATQGGVIASAGAYVANASSDATATFKATFGAARDFPRLFIVQCRGGTAYDTSIAAGGNGGTPASGNLATAVANSFALGWVQNDSGLTLANGTINAVAADGTPTNQDNLGGFYRLLTGTFAAGGAAVNSFGGGVNWTCGLIVLSESVGGGGPRFILGAH